jgi:hypothetical protein
MGGFTGSWRKLKKGKKMMNHGGTEGTKRRKRNSPRRRGERGEKARVSMLARQLK